jgi:hypothetical protein
VGLLAVPRAAVGRAQPFRDPHHRIERREIRERLERRENEKTRAPRVAFGIGERGRPFWVEQRRRMSGGIPRAQQLPIDGRIESDRDGAQRRERVAVESAGWDDVDAGGPALENSGERRRATRTRGQG